jgi:hypothetical protein
MTPTNGKKSVKLDWTRLLGFDQVPSSSSTATPITQDPRIAKIGIKPGIKPGIKVGIKSGIKPGVTSLPGC